MRSQVEAITIEVGNWFQNLTERVVTIEVGSLFQKFTTLIEKGYFFEGAD